MPKRGLKTDGPTLLYTIAQRNGAGVYPFERICALDLATAEGESLEEIRRRLAERRDRRLIPTIGQTHPLERARQRIADREVQSG